MNTDSYNQETMSYLESLSGGQLTLGGLLAAIREGEELTQVRFAEILGVSRQNLCHIEHDRRTVSPKMAASFASKLGYSEKQFIKLALQDTLEREGFHFQLEIKNLNNHQLRG